MEVFQIGPAGRFFDAERCVYVRTVRFGFFLHKSPACVRLVMCVRLSVCLLSVCRARGAISNDSVPPVLVLLLLLTMTSGSPMGESNAVKSNQSLASLTRLRTRGDAGTVARSSS